MYKQSVEQEVSLNVLMRCVVRNLKASLPVSLQQMGGSLVAAGQQESHLPVHLLLCVLAQSH